MIYGHLDDIMCHSSDLHHLQQGVNCNFKRNILEVLINLFTRPSLYQLNNRHSNLIASQNTINGKFQSFMSSYFKWENAFKSLNGRL